MANHRKLFPYEQINQDLYPVAHLLKDFCVELSHEEEALLFSTHMYAAKADSQFMGVPKEVRLKARRECFIYIHIIDRQIHHDIKQKLKKVFVSVDKYCDFMFHLYYCVTRILFPTFGFKSMPCCYLATYSALSFPKKCEVVPYQGMNNPCSKCDMTTRDVLLSDSLFASKPVYLLKTILPAFFVLKHKMSQDAILHMFSRMQFIVSFQNLLLQWAEHYGFIIKIDTMIITRGDGRQISASGLFMQWLTYIIRMIETHVCDSKGGILLHLILSVGTPGARTERDNPKKVPFRFVQELIRLKGKHTVLCSTVRITIVSCP